MDRTCVCPLGGILGGLLVKPQVTVLLPVYDTPPAYLERAIGSVLGQTFEDFELLIVSDGSRRPQTLAALDRAAEQDRRVRLLRLPHRGLTPSLNEGLRMARAELVARHDADDWSEPDRLRLQASFLRDHPETVVVGSAACMHQEGGEPLWTAVFPLSPAAIEKSFWRRNPFVHGSVMFRRRQALEAGGYREALRCSQDYDFFWRLSAGGRGANLPEPLYHYRFTGGSVSAAKAGEQAVAHRTARILAASRRRGEAENLDEALAAAAAIEAKSSSRAQLKQADHLLLAGSGRAAAHAYLRLLREQPASPLAWAKLIRLAIFQTIPAARKMCFR